jgi:hypothetical protein
MGASDVDQQTWGDTFNAILDAHEVREPVTALLLWEEPHTSAVWFGAGVSLFLLVDRLGVGLMAAIGMIAFLQLLVFRGAAFLQQREIAFEGVDLKRKLVLTPDPSAVSKAVEIAGDMIRAVEESIKELSLGSDYVNLAQGLSVLLFMSGLGRVFTLPVLLVFLWTMCFTGPLVYQRNAKLIDRAFGGGKRESSKKRAKRLSVDSSGERIMSEEL